MKSISNECIRPGFHQSHISILFVLVCLVLQQGLNAANTGSTTTDKKSSLAFIKSADGAFGFDTGVVRGKIQANKKSFGLTSVEHVASGSRLSSSMGWFGVYRVFSDGKRYGDGGWSWPSEASIDTQGALVVKCPPEIGRPFELVGRYQWSSAQTLDFEITVIPQTTLRGFEVFLASYFDKTFTNAAALAKQEQSNELIRATKELGDWLTFPRDATAISFYKDGRWQLPPNPVDWTMQKPLASPLCVRSAPSSVITVAIMAPQQDCFAISMPYETEGHYSMYLSLFGKDLAAGKASSVRARLQVFESNDPKSLTAAYTRFIEK